MSAYGTFKSLSTFLFATALFYGCSSEVDNKEPISKVTTSNSQTSDGAADASSEGGDSTTNAAGDSANGGSDTFNGFLSQNEFVDSNTVKASSTASGMRRYLIQEIGFKNPLYEHNESEQVYVTKVLADSHCPDKLWSSLTAEIIDNNTIEIKSHNPDGYSIAYDCQRQPPGSLIKLRTNAKVQGNFYYRAHCPNTDLNQFAGQNVQNLFPLFPGQNPKICPDDAERNIVLQYEFDLNTDSSFTLATGSKDRTIEHNLVRYGFGSKDDITKPCKITKENETFSMTDCKQIKWKQLISYQGWTDGELDPSTNNLEGNETLSFETLVFDSLTFAGAISAYDNGFVHFTHNDIAGSVTYKPGIPSTYEIKDSDAGSLVIPWQQAEAN